MTATAFFIHLAGFAAMLLAWWLYHFLGDSLRTGSRDDLRGLGTTVCAQPGCRQRAKYQDTKTGRCWCEGHAISGGV